MKAWAAPGKRVMLDIMVEAADDRSLEKGRRIE